VRALQLTAATTIRSYVTLSTSIGPYAAAMGLGFLIGVYGHVIKSRTLIIIGIAIIGTLSAYFAFVVAKLGQ
jgi:hypothetical protein